MQDPIKNPSKLSVRLIYSNQHYYTEKISPVHNKWGNTVFTLDSTRTFPLLFWQVAIK
jgi:hypothetical protein